MHPPSQSSRRALAGASLALALLAPWPSAAQSPVAAMRQQVDAEIATLRDVRKPRYFTEERRGQPLFQRRQILGVTLARRLHVIGDPAR